MVLESHYLGWDYSNPETAVVGVALHAFEILFVRIVPLGFIGSVAGCVLLSWYNPVTAFFRINKNCAIALAGHGAVILFTLNLEVSYEYL